MVMSNRTVDTFDLPVYETKAGIVELFGNGSTDNTARFASDANLYGTFPNIVRLGPSGNTVSKLPTASSALKGYSSFVVDANATTYGSTVAGGGSNCVPVFCNGTNWVIM